MKINKLYKNKEIIVPKNKPETNRSDSLFPTKNFGEDMIKLSLLGDPLVLKK